MIHRQTLCDVADNTGARKAMMISVLGAGRRTWARVGEIVVCTVKKAIPGAGVKQGDIVKGVVVRAKYPVRREDGSRVRFDTNAIVLIDEENNPVGTRVFGPVAKELRSKGFMRIVSLAAEVV